MELLYFFLFGLILLGTGFFLYYPYYSKKKEKPKIGIERPNKLDYLKDGFNIIFYNRIILMIVLGIIITGSSVILFTLKLFK